MLGVKRKSGSASANTANGAKMRLVLHVQLVVNHTISDPLVPTNLLWFDSNIDSRYYSDVTNLLDINGGLEHRYSSR